MKAKKLLAFVLALISVLCCISVTAFAENKTFVFVEDDTVMLVAGKKADGINLGTIAANTTDVFYACTSDTDGVTFVVSNDSLFVSTETVIPDVASISVEIVMRDYFSLFDTKTFVFPVAHELDLEDDTETADQPYEATVTTPKTDKTKVQVSWILTKISASVTVNRIWNPDTLAWVEDSDKGNSATADAVTAVFDFVNLSSKGVSATAYFKENKGFSPNVAYIDKNGTEDADIAVVLLGSVVTADGIDLSAEHSGTVRMKLTPAEQDFKSLTESKTDTKYGTYTVLISDDLYSVTVIEQDKSSTKIWVPKGTVVTFDENRLLTIGSYKTMTLSKPESEDHWNYKGEKSEEVELGTVDHTVTENTTIEISGDCLAAGTKITMANGTTKNIENIVEGDEILTFNHETGKLEAQAVYLAWACEAPKTAFTLHFENGIDISVIGDHSFFMKESMNYASIFESNAESYIGKHFYQAQSGRYAELLSVTHETEPVMYYEIYTEYNGNCIAEGMLNAPCDMVMFLNIYKFNDDITANSAQLEKDIEAYGLREYSAEDAFPAKYLEAFRWKYANIVVGKGFATWEELYAGRDAFLAER